MERDRPAPPTRIALCITGLEPGGAERALTELATRLDRQQFEPTVYSLRGRPAGNAAMLVERLEQAGVPLEFLAARRPRDFPRVLARLRSRLAAQRPAIVQSFLFHANLLGTAAARLAGVPIVVTGVRVAERRNNWHLRLARWSDRWVDRHVAVSNAVRDFSLTASIGTSDKWVVIPNSVDVARFEGVAPAAKQSMGVSAGHDVVVCIGRLDPQKGLDWLIEQMPRLLAAGPAFDLVIVGDGPQREELGRLVARLGLAERVHFAGFRGDVPAILAASKFLVLPSRWEGMPNVVLEAMAAGKPVAAARVEGVEEALGPGAAAQTFAAGDGEEMAGKMAAILGDAGLAARLGGDNQQRAREAFSIEAMVARYQALYRTLLAGSE